MVREGRGVVRLYEVGFIEDPLVPGVLEGSCAVVERWRGVVRDVRGVVSLYEVGFVGPH